MKKEITILSNEQFQDIYTNESFRNAVAFAHKCCDKYSNFLHYKALVYPNEYIVTEEQIMLAKAEYERVKAEKVKNIPIGTLIFVGMGKHYPERYEGDLCNHRIRTKFLNNEGKCFFIEVGTGKGNDMRCDHSIDVDLQRQYSAKLDEIYKKTKLLKRHSKEWVALMDEQSEYLKQPYNNFGKLEHALLGKYSKENLLKTVNETFGCNYTSVEVDNYTLRTEDFICKCKKEA